MTNLFARKKPLAKIFIGGRWHELPQEDGAVGKTGLYVEWRRETIDDWNLLKAVFQNKSKKSVKLGACHLVEFNDIPSTGKDDTVFLDSGGGWFSGVQSVMATQPNGTYEYWNDLFTAEEDLEWAKNIQDGDVSTASHYSFGGIAAYNIAKRSNGFIAGFVIPLSNFNGTPFLLNDHKTGKLTNVALSCNFAGYLLEPQAVVESEEAIYKATDNPQQALEDYATLCSLRKNIHLRHEQPPVGWLSWYGYRLTMTADEIDRVADFINNEYPGFGFKYMQIDLGYNKDNLPGSWFETNDHFPKGLKAFADSMRTKGFVPGIWCCAFMACAQSDLMKKHPEAALVGYQKKNGKWFWEPHDESFYLDPTHPEAIKFIKKTMRYFKSLGFKYFKIDFMNRLARVDKDCKPYDASSPRGAKIYRDGMRLILNELDPEDYFYSCSNLTLHSIGLCSTSMTACDIGNTGFRQKLAEGDAEPFHFFARQMTTTMSRYFIHKKLLLLNPDSINIAPPADMEEAWMRILFVGISGGQVFLGDKFDLAAPEIRRMVREVLPPTGEVGRPINFFKYDCPNSYPEIYHFDMFDRQIFAVFNLNDKEEITVNLADAYCNTRQKFHLWEFRERKYLGIVKGSFKAKMPFPSARVYVLTPVTRHPTIIGSTFHFLQQELDNLTEDKGEICGYIDRPVGDTGSIFIYDNGKVKEAKVTVDDEDFWWSYDLNEHK